jgi:hypothetical protein
MKYNAINKKIPFFTSGAIYENLAQNLVQFLSFLYSF